jgi:tRNA-uridine 2-sulfurtransferase
VLGKDTATNTLRVGSREELGLPELIAEDVNWTSGRRPQSPFRAAVKIRYTAKEAPAEVQELARGDRVRVRFDTLQRDITPGQAAVFYDGDVLLGGGIIR